MPRDWKEAPQGYVDVNLDDFEKGSIWGRGQDIVLDPFKWLFAQVSMASVDPGNTRLIRG